MGGMKLGPKVYRKQVSSKSQTSPLGGKIHSKLAIVNKRNSNGLKMKNRHHFLRLRQRSAAFLRSLFLLLLLLFCSPFVQKGKNIIDCFESLSFLSFLVFLRVPQRSLAFLSIPKGCLAFLSFAVICSPLQLIAVLCMPQLSLVFLSLPQHSQIFLQSVYSKKKNIIEY